MNESLYSSCGATATENDTVMFRSIDCIANDQSTEMATKHITDV